MGKDSDEDSNAIEDIDEYSMLLDTTEFKECISDLLKDYIEVKGIAKDLGYDLVAFKVTDYINYYVRLNDCK